MIGELLFHYFADREGLGKGTNIVPYDYPREIWFLVRYPGQLERHQAFDEDGNLTAHVFRPEEYDAIVYHKGYGDLRLNTPHGSCGLGARDGARRSDHDLRARR